MDYIATEIPQKTEFQGRLGGQLHVTGEGTISLHKVNRRLIRFGGKWESWGVGYEHIKDYYSPGGSFPMPDVPFYWETRNAADLSLFDVVQDPGYVPGNKTPSRVRLEAVGSASVSGDKDWDIELDLVGKTSATVILEVNDAVITLSPAYYGEIQVAYSNDKKQWTAGAFRESPFIIKQFGIRTGCIFERDIDFSKIGRYISLRYRIGRVASWGHKSTIIVVAR